MAGCLKTGHQCFDAERLVAMVLMLTSGGWYFDYDVRTRLPLDEIEADCQLDGKKCFVVLFGSTFSPPVLDVLASRPDWHGGVAVVDYVRSQHDPARIHHWTFAGEMIGAILWEHSEWFTAALPERHSMMVASQEQLLFLRGGQTEKGWVHRRRACSARKPKPPAPESFRVAGQDGRIIKGPGDYLHDAILHWVGKSPTNDCQCNSRITQMNAWGPAGCREHLDEIVDWLEQEVKNRGWWKYAVAVPGSRLFIRRMVVIAIKKAECRACGLSSAIPG